MKTAENLLERAAILVGNPGTNISSSTDLACESWHKDYEEFKKQSSFPSPQVLDIYEKHKKKLDALKENRANSDQLKWTDAEIQEVDRQTELLASVLSDLNKVSDPSPQGTVYAEDIATEFKELRVYLEDIYKQGATGLPKDAGNLWIQFSDKLNAFEKKLIKTLPAKQEKKVKIAGYVEEAAREYAQDLRKKLRGVNLPMPDHVKNLGAIIQQVEKAVIYGASLNSRTALPTVEECVDKAWEIAKEKPEGLLFNSDDQLKQLIAFSQGRKME